MIFGNQCVGLHVLTATVQFCGGGGVTFLIIVINFRYSTAHS